MSEKLGHSPEKRGVVFMNPTAEAAHLMRCIAKPRPVGDSVKSAIVRAARRAGIGYERAKSFWYGEARRVDASEMDALRAVAAKRQHQAEEIARHEYRELLDRIARLEARLLAADEDFHRTDVDALRSASGRVGRPDRALD